MRTTAAGSLDLAEKVVNQKGGPQANCKKKGGYWGGQWRFPVWPAQIPRSKEPPSGFRTGASTAGEVLARGGRKFAGGSRRMGDEYLDVRLLLSGTRTAAARVEGNDFMRPTHQTEGIT